MAKSSVLAALGMGAACGTSRAPAKGLASGGEVEEESEAGGGLTEEQIALCEDMLEARGDFGYADRENDNDTAAEKAGKRASRRAKAEMYGQALKAFLMSVDVDD